MAVALSEKMCGFLSEIMPVVVGTKRKDGSVQMNPVWYELRDGYLWLNSWEGSHWMDHLRRDSDVTLFFMDPNNVGRWAQVQGRLVADIPDVGDSHIGSLAARYTGNPNYQKRRAAEQRVILKIEPQRVTGYIDR